MKNVFALFAVICLAGVSSAFADEGANGNVQVLRFDTATAPSTPIEAHFSVTLTGDPAKLIFDHLPMAKNGSKTGKNIACVYDKVEGYACFMNISPQGEAKSFN